MFLLVPAYPGCTGSKAVKRLLLLLLFEFFLCGQEVYTFWTLEQQKLLSIKFLSHGSLSAVKYCKMINFEFYFLFIYSFFYAPLSCVGCYLFYFFAIRLYAVSVGLTLKALVFRQFLAWNLLLCHNPHSPVLLKCLCQPTRISP